MWAIELSSLSYSLGAASDQKTRYRSRMAQIAKHIQALSEKYKKENYFFHEVKLCSKIRKQLVYFNKKSESIFRIRF